VPVINDENGEDKPLEAEHVAGSKEEERNEGKWSRSADRTGSSYLVAASPASPSSLVPVILLSTASYLTLS
jgi:hypothetical protein